MTPTASRAGFAPAWLSPTESTYLLLTLIDRGRTSTSLGRQSELTANKRTMEMRTELVTEFRVEASLLPGRNLQCAPLCKREFQRKLGCQGNKANAAKYFSIVTLFGSGSIIRRCSHCSIIQSCSHCRIKWQKVSVKFQLPFSKKIWVCCAA
jgi:hypothetical protein